MTTTRHKKSYTTFLSGCVWLVVGVGVGCARPTAHPLRTAAMANRDNPGFVLVADPPATATRGKSAVLTPASQPAGYASPQTTRTPYTAPGRTFQELEFGTSIQTTVGRTASNLATEPRAQEASQAAATIGKSSLSGSSAAVSSAGGTTMTVVGKPGMLRGAALGGGMPRQNIFTPQRSPSERYCAELVGAGFFPNAEACRNHFRR